VAVDLMTAEFLVTSMHMRSVGRRTYTTLLKRHWHKQHERKCL